MRMVVERDSFLKAGFDPNEARDDYARWTRSPGAVPLTNINDIAYQGDFHDAMLDDILAALALEGSAFVKEARVWSISGLFRARADAIIKPKDDDPYLFELKTGKASMPSMDQLGTYRAACSGPHVFSPDPKIAVLGYGPGELLPKMKVMFAYTEGPGKRVFFFNFCKLLGL